MPRPTRAVVLLAMLAASIAGCSVFRGSTGAAGEDITVQIDNRDFYDATVYLRWQTSRQRLGQVNGNSQQAFSTPWRGPQLQIEVEMLAGGRRSGDRVSVSPGDEVTVEIPSQRGRLITSVR